MIHAGETFGTEDPRTGEVYTQVAEAQEADVDAAVKAARMVLLSFVCTHTESPADDVPCFPLCDQSIFSTKPAHALCSLAAAIVAV